METGAGGLQARRRRARHAAAALVAGCLVVTLAGCTSLSSAAAPPASALATVGRGTGGTTIVDPPPASTRAQAADRAPAPLQPDPSMTVIESAAQCTIRRELTDARGRVPVEDVFPGWSEGGFADPSEVVPGRDAADRTRCPGELPPDPFCEVLLPWTGLASDESFVVASGARRVVDGYLLAMPHGADPAAPPENLPGTRVVTYRFLELAAGDPKGLGAYLDRSFRTCVKARPTTVTGLGTLTGVEALVGTARSEYRAQAAQVVLLRRGTRLAWAVLDGGGWRKGQREVAVRALAAHLL